MAVLSQGLSSPCSLADIFASGQNKMANWFVVTQGLMGYFDLFQSEIKLVTRMRGLF